MDSRYWLRRFVLALFGSGALLFLVELVKGHEPLEALRFAALWGAVFAGVFTLVGYLRFRRNPACLLPPPKS
ncbi:MAG: hypothetical protein HYZ17_09030 [Betaproteobacteria bacterium]|nr:hypothetical protein [Betaproteobacteria bacterium]